MKRKRYFCDWLKNVEEEKTTLLYVSITIISIIIISVISISCYQVCITKYGEDIKVYCEERYPSLKKIQNKIILEDDEIKQLEENKDNENEKEEYPVCIKYFLYLLSVLGGLVIYFIMFLLFSIVIFIAEYKSRIHKNIDQRRKFHKRSK